MSHNPYLTACMSHSIFKFKIMATTFLLLCHGWALADAASDARRVMERRLTMAEPRTVFDKWQADQWVFAAVECMIGAGLRDEAKKLNKLPIYSGGSHSESKDRGKTCSILAASGPDPVCFDLNSRQPPFASPWAGMPPSYVFLNQGPLPDQGSEHVVGGACHLVRNKIETQQFFSGKAKLIWLAKPSMQTLGTATGARHVRVGTIAFEVQGMPGSPMPMMALVP